MQVGEPMAGAAAGFSGHKIPIAAEEAVQIAWMPA
jgi:hypothetical protein